MRNSIIMALFAASLGLAACGTGEPKPETPAASEPWQIDQFADLRIMRYEIPDWDSLSPQQHVLCYYLSQAALCGRDILWDQNYEHNLAIRTLLETIYTTYQGEKDAKWDAFVTYLKRVWFSNGIHHHYAETKIEPGFPAEYFIHARHELAAPLRDAHPVRSAGGTQARQQGGGGRSAAHLGDELLPQRDAGRG